MKWWPTVLFCVVMLFLFANYTPKEEEFIESLENGCVVYSLHFRNALEARELLGENIWSRVLAIHFYGKLGHAVTVFVYKNNTYVYDPNLGTYPVANYPLYDPLMIAEICFPKLVIRKAYYLEPTFLLHYQTNDSFRIY